MDEPEVEPKEREVWQGLDRDSHRRVESSKQDRSPYKGDYVEGTDRQRGMKVKVMPMSVSGRRWPL